MTKTLSQSKDREQERTMFRYELLRRDIQNDGRNCPVYLGSVEGSRSRPAHHIARDICSQAGFVALLMKG